MRCSPTDMWHLRPLRPGGSRKSTEPVEKCIEAKNGLNNDCFTTRITLTKEKLKVKIESEDGEKIEKAVQEASGWLGEDRSGKDELDVTLHDLERVVNVVMKAYRARGSCSRTEASNRKRKKERRETKVEKVGESGENEKEEGMKGDPDGEEENGADEEQREENKKEEVKKEEEEKKEKKEKQEEEKEEEEDEGQKDGAEAMENEESEESEENEENEEGEENEVGKEKGDEARR